jgi:hypothetical protein
MPCDWQTQYCDSDVEKDEAGRWACLGNCLTRSAANNDACLCDPVGNITASGIYPPDSQSASYCFFGERLDTYMFTGGDGGDGNKWTTRAAFENMFGMMPISLYSKSPYYPVFTPENTGYNLTKSAYLTTNCPTTVNSVLLGDRAAGGDTVVTGGYDTWVFNSCACKKSTNTSDIYGSWKTTF